ncbi:MAG: hypothetical protein WB511_01950 [Nitrososphaeraceae archaeon]|jgi:hypothetical protein
MVDERLAQFLKDGKDWERKPTSMPGVFLLKMPAYKSRSASIAIEINPVDSSGAATKRRGIVIKSQSELDQICKMITNPKIIQLTSSIDEINPEKNQPIKESEVFEI